MSDTAAWLKDVSGKLSERMKKVKLLLCEHCYDVFALSDKLRTCECGRVKGRYINERDAEVSPEGVSLVISRKTLPQAIDNMRRLQAETGDMARRNDYRQANQGRIEEVWVRPNTGPDNPHTRIIEGEEQGTLDKRYLRMPLLAIHKDKVCERVSDKDSKSAQGQ